MIVTCPNCKKLIDTKGRIVDGVGSCPKCGKRLVVRTGSKSPTPPPQQESVGEGVSAGDILDQYYAAKSQPESKAAPEPSRFQSSIRSLRARTQSRSWFVIATHLVAFSYVLWIVGCLLLGLWVGNAQFSIIYIFANETGGLPGFQFKTDGPLFERSLASSGVILRALLIPALLSAVAESVHQLQRIANTLATSR